MAGGKDQKSANEMMKQGNAVATGQGSNLWNRNQQDLDQSRTQANDIYGSLRAGYGNMANAGAPNLDDYKMGITTGGGGNGGGGGSSGIGLSDVGNRFREFADKGAGISGDANQQLKDTESSYRDFMKTGGWDPNRVASMDENIRGFKDFAKTGGIDDASMTRMRGNGVFDEFAKTGGYSEADKGNIRSRSNAQIPQFFGDLKNEANRVAAVQGGAGPGRAALMSRFARGQAGASADAALNTEIGIKDKVNAGRQWGGQGVASSEGALQGLRTGNMLAGLHGASDTEKGLQESIRAGKEYGTSGLGALGENQRTADMNAGEINARYKMQGLGGMSDLAQSDAARAMAGSGNADANARWAAEFQAQQRAQGLAGLGGLYTSSPEEYMQNKQFGLNTMNGMSGNTNQAGTAIKAGNKGIDWTKMAAMGGAAAATYFTGGAAAPALGAAARM